jgi:hypothetical protein
VLLEQAMRALWAPLDRVDAARPDPSWRSSSINPDGIVLSWHCPFEVRATVGTAAPLRRLPVRWRALTLVVLQDLFGAGLVSDDTMPEAASRLFSRVAPTPYLTQKQVSGITKGMIPVDRGKRRVQRLSKIPVHRSSGNFVADRADYG